MIQFTHAAQRAGGHQPMGPTSWTSYGKDTFDGHACAQVEELLAIAARHYQSNLQASRRAQQYLRGRRIDVEGIARYAVGYAQPLWRDLWDVLHGFDMATIDASGLLVGLRFDQDGPRFDRFRGRIMFPIRSLDGRIRGFGGRALGGESARAKYLNSPQSERFSKRELVYGLYEAQEAIRARGRVVVVEGYVDVISVNQAGVDEVVGTLGTACTSSQVQAILGLAPSITFCFDGDEAGQRATRRAIWTVLPMAIDSRSFRFARLPSAHDPDSMVRQEGAAALAACVERAVPLGEALIEAVGDGCELQWPEGRARFAARAAQAWCRLPAGQERDALLERAAVATRMSMGELAEYFAGFTR